MKKTKVAMSSKPDRQRPSLINSNRISKAYLLNRLPLETRLYLWPFLLMYLGWLAVVAWHTLSVGGFNELWLIPFGLLATTNFIAIMSVHWSVAAEAWFTCKRVSNVMEASLIAVIPKEHGGKAAVVPLVHNNRKISFSFHHQTFIWNEDRKKFSPLEYPDQLPFAEYRRATGLTAEQAQNAREAYGLNKFEIAAPTFLELFKEHAVAPFFVFQMFCVGLWCLDEYWYYSLFTLFMLVVFESTVVAQRLKNMSEFQSMSIPSFPIFVKRNGKWMELKTHELLPGDLCFLSFPENEETELTIPCDMLLLAGTCIVNEAMISGESTPLLKESILEHRPEDEPQLTLDIAAADKAHVLFGGTRCLQLSPPHPDIMTQHLYSGKKEGCLALVLRTGFGTMQGQLVRTMIFSSERMSANNVESFIFILFLLIFAIAAAGYVLWHGLQDTERSRYKLLLECVLIITSVVPPELPMELSLAVNNSLVALSKFAIFCMEPFRIPLAGKLDICCFDKTGTLTGENLVVEGVLTNPSTGLQQSKIPNETCLVIGSCHSLFNVNDQIAGDPMEKTAVDFINWKMPRNDFVKDLKGSNGEVEILNRFPFSSALKRMSCVIKCKGTMMITSKGAPEMMKKFFTKIPSWYDETFNQLALSGARVIALGIKSLSSPLSIAQVRGMKREHAESNLQFVGFLIFRCPLKPDSKKAVKSLLNSSHKVMMITGDNALTAIYTAKQLEMNLNLPIIQIDVDSNSFEYHLIAEKKIEDCNIFNLNTATISEMKVKQYCFCFTGNALDLLNDKNPDLLNDLLPCITIFSRTSPSQKEFILTTLKTLGFTTLMCGDGTNDVGALKQAHVGVALLDGRPEDLRKILDQAQRIAMKKRKAEAEQARLKWQARMEAAKAQADGQNPLTAAEILKAKMDEISAASNNMEDEVPMVKLGDASVAAPFTSKISTIESVCNIVRQGRCTLVTTIQMFKILALNSLISAYGLSVLHLAGIRYGDFQVTITGMLLSACFLFLTRSQPLKELSAQRPQSNILNAYLLLSVLFQFAIHVGTLIFVLGEANRYTFPYKIGIKTEFSPSLTNTAVYLLSLIMQVSTFVVNYEGRPFREGLFENKNLRNSLGAVSAIAILAAMEAFPDFNEWLQLVPMPPAFRNNLLAALFVDFFGCLAVDKIMHYFFFNSKAKL